jgi:hypothetical protein
LAVAAEAIAEAAAKKAAGAISASDDASMDDDDEEEEDDESSDDDWLDWSKGGRRTPFWQVCGVSGKKFAEFDVGSSS